MAQKELTIKIKVQGQEIELTGKQIDVFNQNLVDMKAQLDQLGTRTEKNSEQFDKLKGDIESLEQAFGSTKQEVKQTSDAIEDSGKKTEDSGKKTEDAAGKTKSYAAQIRILRTDLAGLGDRTAANADQYDNLTAKIRDLSEKQEDLQFGTKKVDDALSALPGPIGKAASTFKTFDDGLKNAKSAMNGLTKQFPILKNAIAATGIGALVIILGLLVAAIMKAFQSFKPLQDAVGKFGVLFDILGKAIQPIIDLIGGALTFVLEGLAKTLAFVTGKTDEYNKAVADKAAIEQLEKNVKRQEELLDSQGYKYDEFTQRKIKANIDYNKKVVELNADETKTEAEKQALLKAYREKANYEIETADKDRKKKNDDAAKSDNDKIKQKNDAAAQLNQDYEKRLNTIQNENALLRLKDENEKGKLKLEQDYKNQLAEINQTKFSEKKKQELRNETQKNYELKLKEFNANIKKLQEDADKDLAKQTRDRNTAMIADDKTRMEEEAKNRRDDALAAIDETKASEEAKAKAKLAINQQYAKDVANVGKEIAKKNKDNVYNEVQYERETRKLGLDNRLKAIDISFQSEVAKVKARSQVFKEQAAIDRQAELDNLDKLYADKEKKDQNYYDRKAAIEEGYTLAIKENELETEKDILDARQKNRDAVNMLADSIGALGVAMGEESAAGKALIKVQQGLALATTISAIADQFKGLGQAAKLPFPANVIAIATFIGTIGTAVAQFKTLFGMGPKDLSKGGSGGGSAAGSNSAQQLGKGYATGGIVSGPGTSTSDSIPVRLSNGEGVMTAGAITMFRPMLSMMNQMGGGTSFNSSVGGAAYDNPNVTNPTLDQSPTIIKTYVVSSELTTDAQRQARLKDLSTL
jgi:hypothetical protein